MQTGPDDRDQVVTARLRWVLAPIGGLVAWHATLFLGLVAVGVLDSMCPPDEMVSGMCQADWYEPAFDALVAVFSGISAVLVVLVPALIAPTHRLRMAWIAYGVGAAFAIFFALGTSLYPPAAAALLGGATAVAIAHRLWPRNQET